VIVKKKKERWVSRKEVRVKTKMKLFRRWEQQMQRKDQNKMNTKTGMHKNTKSSQKINQILSMVSLT
jgi:hypothetical protein